MSGPPEGPPEQDLGGPWPQLLKRSRKEPEAAENPARNHTPVHAVTLQLTNMNQGLLLIQNSQIDLIAWVYNKKV